MGVTGYGYSLPNIPSAVNYDSKFYFNSTDFKNSDRIGNSIPIAYNDPAMYDAEKGEYTLWVLALSKKRPNISD